jgi:hypothetical protein
MNTLDTKTVRAIVKAHFGDRVVDVYTNRASKDGKWLKNKRHLGFNIRDLTEADTQAIESVLRQKGHEGRVYKTAYLKVWDCDFERTWLTENEKLEQICFGIFEKHMRGAVEDTA